MYRIKEWNTVLIKLFFIGAFIYAVCGMFSTPCVKVPPSFYMKEPYIITNEVYINEDKD